ncbi:MAG TPA: hypothetical protein VLW50_25825 [Streptosporangiaceae bacterium]|nr:hypothetical protein [Streptosporangiaceae bacterium]
MPEATHFDIGMSDHFRLPRRPAPGAGRWLPSACSRAVCWRFIRNTSSPTVKPANTASGLVAAVSRSASVTGWPGGRVAGNRLNMADVPGHAHCQAGQRGHPRRHPLAGGPAVQVGDIKSQLTNRQEHVVSVGHDIACQPVSR